MHDLPLLLYYITDRRQFGATESQRHDLLLKKVSEAALAGIDYIQLREKDLSGRALQSLAKEAAQIIRHCRSSTQLLINSRTDIALATEADGVHLTSNDISPAEVRTIWREANGAELPIIAVSCHSEVDVIAAERALGNEVAGIHARPVPADFVVFGPVFEKSGATQPAARLDQLSKASRHRIPVLALGGVTLENAGLCIEAGASGIAAIRLFQENDVAESIRKLRALE